VLAVVSGNGSPGATTSTVALATCWPADVLVADCDPGGGDIALGWCHRQLLGRELDLDAGVASFVEATRRGHPATAAGLAPHLQTPAQAPHVDLLVAVRTWQDGSQVDEMGWQQLAVALSDITRRPTAAGSAGRDVLVDCGRLGPFTPWPVLESADLVLAAARPGPRQVLLACRALEELAGRIAPSRLAVLACATDPAATSKLIEARGVLPAAELPRDRLGAALLLGESRRSWRRFERTKLGRAAHRAARRLHRRLHTRYADPAHVGLASRGVG